MSLTSKAEIKNLLKKYETRPIKKFGQNFLIDRVVIRRFLEAADLKKEDIILEVGPGIGNLTQELAKKAKGVIAVEKDQKMIEILKETLRDFKNVEIIQGDIRKTQISKLKTQSYKVMANLPFYLTAPVIRKFLELDPPAGEPPKEMVFIVQKEVAQRICTKVPDMNLLAVSVQFYSKPKIIAYVSKKSFWPQPKVDGAIIKIIPRESAYPISVNPLLFFKIVKAGFSQPRKQILNNLLKVLKLDKDKTKSWLLENKIQPTQRAETLSVEDWISLTKNVKID